MGSDEAKPGGFGDLEGACDMAKTRGFLNGTERYPFDFLVAADGEPSVRLPDFGYAIPFMLLWQALRRDRAGRIQDQAYVAAGQRLEFSLEGRDYVFYADDWGGGSVHSRRRSPADMAFLVDLLGACDRLFLRSSRSLVAAGG